MNTIRRPRKRPRVNSVSFNTLGWLLIREAALRVLYFDELDRWEQAARVWVARAPKGQLVRLVAHVLAEHPHVQYFP